MHSGNTSPFDALCERSLLTQKHQSEINNIISFPTPSWPDKKHAILKSPRDVLILKDILE